MVGWAGKYGGPDVDHVCRQRSCLDRMGKRKDKRCLVSHVRLILPVRDTFVSMCGAMDVVGDVVRLKGKMNKVCDAMM